MTIFIGGAWPYANGSLHIGHIASLLPGDILARYFRLKGEDVCYVSGSDCHGTPIEIRAFQEGIKPSSIANQYHTEFDEDFKRLGFSYSLYNRTDDVYHKTFVQAFFTKLYDDGFIYTKDVEQSYCEACARFLPDRFIIGSCPHCGSLAKGDQCDACGNLLEPSQLVEKKCGLCGEPPCQRVSKHLYFSLSRFDSFLKAYVSSASGWRTNAINQSKHYLDLPDQPERRDIDFSWREFIHSHNGELLGAFGNFVNRNLVFIYKSFQGRIPEGHWDSANKQVIQTLYETTGNLIEAGCFKDALDGIFTFIRSANKYFDAQQPWQTIKEDPEKCHDTLYTCVQIILNLSNLLEPFLPFSAAKIRQMLLSGDPDWTLKETKGGLIIATPEILFERIDKKVIDEETHKLITHGQLQKSRDSMQN